MIEIIEFSQNYLKSVAGLYDRVFTGSPWFDPPLGEKKAMKYISMELSKKIAVAYLAISENIPIGFGWGYQLDWEKFVETKYDTKEGKILLRNFRQDETLSFYISEVGVDPDFQNNRIGSRLTNKLASTDKPLLMRTLKTSPMLSIALKQLLMQPIISPDLDFKDPENPNRVILIK